MVAKRMLMVKQTCYHRKANCPSRYNTAPQAAGDRRCEQGEIGNVIGRADFQALGLLRKLSGNGEAPQGSF